MATLGLLESTKIANVKFCVEKSVDVYSCLLIFSLEFELDFNLTGSQEGLWQNWKRRYLKIFMHRKITYKEAVFRNSFLYNDDFTTSCEAVSGMALFSHNYSCIHVYLMDLMADWLLKLKQLGIVYSHKFFIIYFVFSWHDYKIKHPKWCYTKRYNIVFVQFPFVLCYIIFYFIICWKFLCMNSVYSRPKLHFGKISLI